MRRQEILDRLTAHRKGRRRRQRRHSWPATEGREKKGIEENRSGKYRTGQLQLSEKGTNRGLFPPVEAHCLLKKRGLNGILSRSRSCSYVGASHRISKDFRWLSASLPADSPPFTRWCFCVMAGNFSPVYHPSIISINIIWNPRKNATLIPGATRYELPILPKNESSLPSSHVSPGLPETRWRPIMHLVNQVVNLETKQDPSGW